MGVRGLTTFINNNQDDILRRYFLHDSSLVIDGHSLCAQLYRRLNCFSAFGGDYDKFAAFVKTFFKNLKKCNITSYVIFDGGLETRKLKTAYSRLRSKINGCSRLDPVSQGSLQIFPLLLRDVFKEVLNEMSVPYTVCEFEADDEIASLARHLNCPVLSFDSDFFIYNVLYIPFNTLELKPKPLEDTDGNKFNALECRLYKVEYLIKHFGGLQEDMLPLLATILGNDFVEKRVFNKFFSQLKMPKSRKKTNEQQRCIHGLFKWLQNETLDSAITKILGRLKKNRKERTLMIIKKSIAGYNKTHCKSLKYFNISEEPAVQEPEINIDDFAIDDETVSEGEEDTSDDNTDDDDDGDDENEAEETGQDPVNDSGLPEWVSVKIRNQTIPKSYITLFTHHLYFCSPQAEDYTDEDASLCSLPILRFAFDLLTDFNEESFTYVSRENDCNYKRLTVDKDNATSRLFDTSFSELSEEQSKQYFHHFIKEKLPNLDSTSIEMLPQNFQLYMISILFWVSKCNVPLSHIHSLFICYIMLEVIDEKTGTFRGHHFFNNKYSKKIEEVKRNPTAAPDVDENGLYLNKNKVQYEDCLIAAAVLLKHFEIDDSIRKRPKTYDNKRMHSFAQFQCCLLQFNCLNNLCTNPYTPTTYCNTYNGTFIYNIALKLENQTEPSTFLEQYLKGATTVLMFYKSLCKVFDKLSEKMGLSTTKSINVKKTRRGRKKGAKIDDEIAFIVKGFESEVVI